MYRALQVNLDEDQYIHLSPEAPILTGHTCGNQFQPGILTRDETVRLHSCEKGTRCVTMAKGNVVWITPIVTHLSSTSDMAEVGIGGGLDDLASKDELVLSPEDAKVLLQRYVYRLLLSDSGLMNLSASPEAKTCNRTPRTCSQNFSSVQPRRSARLLSPCLLTTTRMMATQQACSTRSNLLPMHQEKVEDTRIRAHFQTGSGFRILVIRLIASYVTCCKY